MSKLFSQICIAFCTIYVTYIILCSRFQLCPLEIVFIAVTVLQQFIY